MTGILQRSDNVYHTLQLLEPASAALLSKHVTQTCHHENCEDVYVLVRLLSFAFDHNVNGIHVELRIPRNTFRSSQVIPCVHSIPGRLYYHLTTP